MNTLCDDCKGSCCEGIILQPYRNPDLDRWLSFHGTPLPDGSVHVPCRCQNLTTEGRCGIYDDRPKVCINYKVDGPSCRRTREMKGLK